MDFVLLNILLCGTLLVIMTKTITAKHAKLRNYTSKDDIVEMMFKHAFPKGYDRDDSPANASIGAAIHFLSLSSVTFSRMEMEVEFHFFAVWDDDRLTFDDSLQIYYDKYLRLPDEIKKDLWVPKIYFPECKLCKNTVATGKEPRPTWFLPESKKFVIAFRDSMIFSCQYDLTFYPFDVHTCSIDLELDAEDGIELNDSFSDLFSHAADRFISSGMPAEYDFDKLFVKHVCSPRSLDPDDSKDYCLQYGIRFHRISAYYLMLIYTPSFVIVVISWINFWLPTDATAPRITLGLTSLLTLTTQFSSAQKGLPPVAYVKALDVWMIMCVIMVFGSLLEFTLAHNTKVQPSDVKPVLKRKELKHLVPTYTAKKVKRLIVAKKPQEAINKGKVANPLDVKSRIAFPFVFMLFNMIYWPYYGRGG